MNTKLLISAILASALATVGCDSSSTPGGDGGTGGGTGGTGGGTGGTGGGGTGGTPWVPIEDCEAAIATTGSYSIEGAPETATDDCNTTLTATGTDDNLALQTAIEDSSSGETICLEAGTYAMNNSIFVTDKQNLTIKGIGPTPNDVKLDYAGGAGIANRGFDVTADGFTIENMWIVNTPGNGVEVKAGGSVFRKLYVTWDNRCEGAGAPANCNEPCADTAACGDELLVCLDRVCDAGANAGDSCSSDDDCTDGACLGECLENETLNGAYAAYPTVCTDTLVEYVEVTGASDAGLYVGQCEGGIIRYNKVYGNVAGLEVENSKDVDVYGNLVFDNAGGLLALQEPNLARLANENVLMRDNFVYCNNHYNFAKQGSTVSNIPVGTGAMSFAGDGIELRGNIMDSNWSTGLLLVSNVILCQLAEDDCGYQEGYNPYPEQIYVHDNVYINNGTNPQDLVGDIAQITGIPTPEVIWDGYINLNGVCDDASDNTGDSCVANSGCPNGACTFSGVSGDPGICLGDPVDVTYVDLTQNECQVDENGDSIVGDAYLACVLVNNTDDTTGRDCTLDPIVLP
jgi:parallel beta-helix repeat protein